jgi:hypothetical protein
VNRDHHAIASASGWAIKVAKRAQQSIGRDENDAGDNYPQAEAISLIKINAPSFLLKPS